MDFIYSVKKLYGNKQVILAGNSIGGYIITSVAAKLTEDGHPCAGLVLFNSAGKILEGGGLTPNESAQFPEYEGPSSYALRLFGNLFISILRPRVKPTVCYIGLYFCSLCLGSYGGCILQTLQSLSLD